MNKNLGYSIEIDPKSSARLRRMLRSTNKPDNLKYPNKHRKWRIQKKWFNRYEKPTCIGCECLVDDKRFCITDVKIEKCGRKFKTYNFTAK